MNENDKNWTGLINFIKNCDKPMNELDKLRKMLDEAKIPYESYQKEWGRDKPLINWSGEAGKYEKNQVIYGRYDGGLGWKIDGICQWGSYGAKQGMIETYSDLGVDEDGEPMVMTAQEVFDIIKKDWEKGEQAMKPIIIYQEVKDDKITLTKEEFEKYLEDAYQAGYSDGSNSFTAKGYTWTSTDSDLTKPEEIYKYYEKIPYWMSPYYQPPEITCTTTPEITYSTDGCCTDGYINMKEYEKTCN